MALANYELDDGTIVSFEADPGEGFRPASPNDTPSKLLDAIRPAIDAGHLVLNQAQADGIDEITVTFAIKVSGKANFLVAKAATEGSFEVSLKWKAPE